MDNLLPCPFCGGPAEDGYEGFCEPRYRVMCLTCGAKTAYCGRPEDPEKLWNVRSTLSALPVGDKP